ncbi:guanylyl cyclase-activating protein 3 isoform X1 [Prionailurus viverrinus]|uniref:guanylyl cyclase-activating protein 3 isoform X1 n=1 Tax=Prionailurus viverrinus TaxID=61388 RepID=UPI001FF5D34D|nr:guanylyl cyclase-activating protein 3 isoform X1 [Prionailurus viverrinus]
MGNNESIAGGQKAVPAKETYVWYKKFMREYPSGLQTLHEFKTLLGLQGLNQKANQHVDQVYNTFDMNKDGFIDFLEFIAAINLVVRGKMEQKLKWYFKLYDADGNGSIDKKELLNIFMAVQALNGQQTLSPEEFTNLVFHKIDKNNDGELTLEEFINGTEEDQDLLEIVSKSFDFSSVLKIIYNGNQPDTEGKFPSNLVTRLI